jgi:hypothetical protein
LTTGLRKKTLKRRRRQENLEEKTKLEATSLSVKLGTILAPVVTFVLYPTNPFTAKVGIFNLVLSKHFKDLYMQEANRPKSNEPGFFRARSPTRPENYKRKMAKFPFQRILLVHISICCWALIFFF